MEKPMKTKGQSALLTSFLVASFGVVAGCGSADPTVDEPVFPAQLAADLQASMDDTVATGVSPGVALHVAHPERGSWAGAAGLGDVDQHRAMVPEGHLRAGSIMKPLVATAVLQRVEAGLLSLDATLTELLPADVTKHVPRADEITVRMLLGHRSGVPDFLGQEMLMAAAADQAHVWTLEEFLSAAKKQPPTGAPGTTYSYSNTNYVLLGEILRAQTGRDWRDVVTENVVKRAKMTHTSLPLPGDRAVPAPVNFGYINLGAGLVDFTRMDPSMAGASGGHALVTTPADLTTFLQALMAGKLFERPATLEQMLSFLPAGEPGSPETEYGLGIEVCEIDGIRLVGHMGKTAGYWSFMWQLPKTGYFVTGTMNASDDLGAFAFPIAKLLSK